MCVAPGNHRPGALVTLAVAVVIVAALYAALTTPLDPDIATARGPGGRLMVSAVAFNGPAQVDGVAPGDLLTGHVGHGAARAWLVRAPRGARLVLAAPPLTALSVLVVILGGSLLVLGLVVLVRSPERPAATAFWRLSLLLAGVLSLYPAAEHGLPWVLALHFVILRLCGPALLELALVFPVGTHPLARRPLVRLLLWLPAFAVLPLYPTIVAEAHGELAWVPELVLVAYVAGAAVRLLWSRLHAHSAPQRAHLHYLTVGLLSGLTPPLLLTVAPQLASGRPLVPADVTLLALATLPLSVGLAIARVELFGIAVRRRTVWLLRRAAAPAVIACAAGLGMLAARGTWRALLPFAEGGTMAVVTLLYYTRRFAVARPRRLVASQASGIGLQQRVPAPERTGADMSSATAVCGDPVAGPLSPREMEVLAYAARGLRTREIAQHLHMGERTVGTHLRRIFEKLDVHTRTEALYVARERGILAQAEGDSTPRVTL